MCKTAIAAKCRAFLLPQNTESAAKAIHFQVQDRLMSHQVILMHVWNRRDMSEWDKVMFRCTVVFTI